MPAAAAACAAAASCRLLPRLLVQQQHQGGGSACRHAWNVQQGGLLARLQQAAAAAAASATAAASRRGGGSLRCFASSAAASESGGNGSLADQPDKKRIVFCGTPEVAALVLRRLLHAAAQPGADFEVAAVVTQPGRPRGRGNRGVPQPSAVHAAAAAAGLSPDRILAPERPGDRQFLASLAALRPDLCVTAAYGNYLPSTFLALPAHGTLNIHPSLLPRYRGAAPVQRALQDGLHITGVTVLYTVKEMDAGPILAQQKMTVDPDAQAPELLDALFELGCDLLLGNLDAVWAGLAGEAAAQPQDHAAATHAPKLLREEAVLDFSQPAAVCHNKVRAFAGWPGTFASFQLVAGAAAAAGSEAASSSSSDGSGAEDIEIKIVRTRLAEASAWGGGEEEGGVAVLRDAIYVRCGDGSVLQVLELQVPGKRAMAARDFVNGLKGRTLRWRREGQAVVSVPA